MLVQVATKALQQDKANATYHAVESIHAASCFLIDPFCDQRYSYHELHASEEECYDKANVEEDAQRCALTMMDGVDHHCSENQDPKVAENYDFENGESVTYPADDEACSQIDYVCDQKHHRKTLLCFFLGSTRSQVNISN